MALFNKLNTPIFLKEDSDITQYINRLKDLQGQATGKVKDDIAREIKLATYGEIGEKTLAFELKNSGMPMYIIHDLYLEFEGLSAQIDYVVVTRKMNFLIECKNLFGNIDIDNHGNFIRRYSWNTKTVKEGIYSPITQNQRHLDVLKHIIRAQKNNAVTKMLFDSAFDAFNKSIVVLANPKTVLNDKYAKKDVKDKVIRSDQLIQYIKAAVKNSKELASNDDHLKARGEGLLRLHKPSQTDYAKKYEEIISLLAEARIKPKAVQPAAIIKPVAVIQAPAAAIPIEAIPAPALEKPVKTNKALIPVNDEIVAKLKAFRLEKSREENIQAYRVFTNNEMTELIDKKPISLEELLGVSGFGPIKVEKYGETILSILT